MERKIYFVGEGTVNGETVQTAKFNQVINPDTMEQIFEDVFQITECADFEKYEQKEDFMASVLAMVYAALSVEGEVGEEITFTAIEEGTDIFLWGVQVNMMDEDNFQYTTLDWKSKGTLKYMDDGASLTSKQFAKELADLGENKTFNVQSDDSGSVHFSLYGCKVETSLEEGIKGEINMFKPYSAMDITLDFAIIDNIIKEENSIYRLVFNNGMSDVVISVVE